jgi:RHH-type rel operon transcriptional repressor/antitoxin RelB
LRRFLVLAIRLPGSIEKRLDRLAKRTGWTKTHNAREAILRQMEDLEDLYQGELSFARLRTGKHHAIPLEEVMKRHGMEG